MVEDQTGNVISILGFYLSLISILGSFYYIHLGNWVKQIQTTKMKWNQYESRNQEDKKIECFLEVSDEINKQPLFGFIFLVIFMIILGFFAENLKSIPTTENKIWNFLYFPEYIFFGFFFVISVAYLIYGYSTAISLYHDIEQKLK